MNCGGRIIEIRCGKANFTFEYLSGGILDGEKGCLVAASSHEGKQWIGVRTHAQAQHGGFFLMSPPLKL